MLQKNPSIILGGIFENEKIEDKIKDLEEISLKENFWKNKNLAKKTVKQKKLLRIYLILTKKHLKN